MKKGVKTVLIILAIVLVLIVLKNVLVISNKGNGFSNNNINYGSDSKQKFDFYPSNFPSDKLIIIIHGGAWVLGDKNAFTEHSKFFANKGYNVINMNYRLAPKNQHDSQIRDIQSLIKKVNENPERYNLPDNYKIILLGHSAGAHLSALYGVEEYKYGTQNVDGVIAIAGPYEFKNLYMGPQIKQAFESYKGDYSDEDVSPAENIQFNDKTNFLLISAGQDNLVPENQMTLFENALHEKNVYVETMFLENRNHESVQSLIPSNDEVAQKIIDFIKRKI